MSQGDQGVLLLSPPSITPVDRSFREAAVQYANTDYHGNIKSCHFEEKPNRRFRRLEELENIRPHNITSYTLQKKSESVVNLW
jgi:hypothetical protein